MRKILPILLGIFIAVNVFGEEITQSVAPDMEVLTVKEIVVVNNKEVPDEVIISNMQTKKGNKFSIETLISDYNKLIKLPYIDAVAIYPKVSEGEIRLEVEVTEKPESKKALLDVGVVPNSEREGGSVNLPVVSIEVRGLVQIKKDEVLKDVPLQVGGYYTQKKVIDTQRKIGELGYFRDVTFEKRQVGKGIAVTFKVVENPVLNGVNIVGSTVYTIEDLLAMIKTKPGKVFSVMNIRDDREAIINKYHGDGYVLAEMKDVYITNNGILEFMIGEGVVRNVKFKKMVTKNKGNRRVPTDDMLDTKDFVISRELEIKEGEVFNVKNYDNSSKNLMRLGIFKNIKYEANSIPGDIDGKSIIILIDEDRTASIQAAASYGSQTKFVGTLSLRSTNWAGRNQVAGITGEVSQNGSYSFSLDFQDPWIMDTDRVSWGWSVYKTRESVSNSMLYNRIERWGLGLNVGKGLSRNVRFGLGTTLEKVYESMSSGAITDKYYNNSWTPYITYDTRNNYLNATSGVFIRYDITGGYTSDFIMEPNDSNSAITKNDDGSYSGYYESSDYYQGKFYGRSSLDLRFYHRMFFKKNTMAYRATFGVTTLTTKESQRLWAGGENLRGYPDGYFRGTQKITFTIENRTQFNDILGLVLFVDAGRAWNQQGKDPGYKYDNVFYNEIALSAGAGLRLNTPMGPIRLDLGFPIGNLVGDVKKGWDGKQFIFNMGQSF
ncbi:MAG: BamA/OMP85 family outer membrane protein [Fusobacteriaceae bacterium]